MIEALPSAPMAEKYILSCMMTDPAKNIRRALGEGLTAEMFHHHPRMFRSLAEHFTEHGSVDLTHFIQAQALNGNIDGLGGASGISEIYTYAAGNADQWGPIVGQLRETYALRLAMVQASRVTECQTSEEAIAATTSTLESLRAAVMGPRRSVGAKEATKAFLAQMEADRNAGDIPGKSTGFDCIDHASGGLRPGQLWVWGGKPSTGKSAAMYETAAHFVRQKERVIVFSLELTKIQVVSRLLCRLAGIRYRLLTHPKELTLEIDLRKFQGAAKELLQAQLWIDDHANQTIESIAGEAMRIRDLCGGVDLIVVDYIQLISGIKGLKENREQEVARVSRGLKQLAKELNCPVLSGTQLNEEGQSRESKAIQQDADVLLYIAEDGVKVAKMRDAERNQVLPLVLNGAMQRFQAP